MPDAVTISWLQILVAFAGFFLTLAGGAILRDRQLLKYQQEREDKMLALVQAGDRALHERINTISDWAVRKVDLDADLANMQRAIGEVRDEQRSTNQRIDHVLTTLMQNALNDNSKRVTG